MTRRQGSRLGAGAATIAALLLAFAQPAMADAPWAQAERINADLFKAQSSLLLDGGAGATRSVDQARSALAGELERGLRASSARELRTIEAQLAAARQAAGSRDEVALAAARGRILAAMRRGAYAVTLSATRSGRVAEARAWLLIRDFRQATRFTRPGVDATAALQALEAGRIDADQAVTAVKKDLTRCLPGPVGHLPRRGGTGRQRGFATVLAHNAALAAGYWPILAAEYERQRSATDRRAVNRDFAALDRAAAGGNAAAFLRARDQVARALDGFTAAPFAPEEQARRANQLTRFLDLVPIEYDDGTEDGRVTIPFELQEAVAFTEGAESAFNDLEATLQERDPSGVATLERAFAELEGYARAAHGGGTVAPLEDVEAAHDRASSALDSMLPEEWKESGTDADFDLMAIALDQMQAAASAGELKQAEQARLSAYAFFEFGPELQLRALDPALVADVEGLVWYGARDQRGSRS